MRIVHVIARLNVGGAALHVLQLAHEQAQRGHDVVVVAGTLAAGEESMEYVADELCVELKSWKLYLWSYRDEGAFHEAVTNRILDDLVAAVSPRRARVEGAFNVRGGITTTIVAEFSK